LGGVFKKAGSKGSKGVRLVISDAHEGLKAAIKKILTGKCMAKMPCTFYEKRIKPGTKALSGNGIIDNTDNICPE